MSIEKAKERAKFLASIQMNPSHGISALAEILYELTEVLEDMSAKIDKLAETQAPRT
jgi:hypothetical protein